MRKSVFLVAVLILACLVCFKAAEANVVIEFIDDKEVKEGKGLSFEIEATSDNGPVDFGTEDMPDGAFLDNFDQIDDETFVCDFVWEPNYTQDGIYDVLIIAEDEDSGDAVEFSIEVEDVNRPPGMPLQPHPSDGEAVFYDDYLELSWEGERRDVDDDEVVFQVLVWKQGEPHNMLYDEIVDELFFRITDVLEADKYFWRVIAIDEHGAEKKSPNWKFTCSQWFKIQVDAMLFAIMVRKPGEYTFKWTDITMQSNGDLGLCFQLVDAEGPNGEEISIVYGVKEQGEIEWYGEEWVMEIPFSKNKNGYTFELYAKVIIEPKHSAGLYQGQLVLNVSMTN